MASSRSLSGRKQAGKAIRMDAIDQEGKAEIDFTASWKWLREQVSFRGMNPQHMALLKVLFQFAGYAVQTDTGYVVRVHAKSADILDRLAASKHMAGRITVRTLLRWCNALGKCIVFRKEYPGGGRSSVWEFSIPNECVQEAEMLDDVVSYEDAAEVVRAYPKKCRPDEYGGVNIVRRALVMRSQAGADVRKVYEQMLAGARSYASSETVSGGFVYGFRRFIDEGLWAQDYEPDTTETDEERRERIRKSKEAANG